MPTRPAAAKPKKTNGKIASPYGYPFWDWVAREDPDYVRARAPLSALSIGEGKELSVKYREMVIIGILAFRGRQEGVVAHMRRAIEHGATLATTDRGFARYGGLRTLDPSRPGPPGPRPRTPGRRS